MEQVKKLRTPLRASFTKAVNALEEFLKTKIDETFKEQLQANMDGIERRAEQVADLDKVVMEKMMEDPDTTEEQFAAECDGISGYEDKLHLYRRKVEKILGMIADKAISEFGSTTSASCSGAKSAKKYKLPKIEFIKFGGEIREWLGFWAQFQKIHKDEDMAEEDKFHYLRQCTIENSKAREVVDSFPMTAENYAKVVNHLVNRFGNKDTLVEVYVRELLKLVLANALNPTKKMVISSLYDKLETQLRALETLEVTRDEFVAILYPLVESCLPEELLRAWERHRIIPTAGVKIDRLSHLMLFLKGEVESEERIVLARSGFGDQLKDNQKKKDKLYDIPTAAGLFVGSTDGNIRKNCIFCSESHYSDQCPSGKKMKLIDRQKKCDEQKACYACLGIGHMSWDCRRKNKLKCRNCGGRHKDLMCNKNSTKQSESKADNKETRKQEEVKAEHRGVIPTKNLLVQEVNKEETVLSTLLIRIRNGEMVKIVRAAIDSGSHKTYMLKSLINELGLVKNGQERLYHELFGGHLTDETIHGRYTICAENIEGTVTQYFDVLEQERICYSVPKIKKGPWLDELQRENIILSDVGVGASEIQLLIGGNVAGRLLIGIHKLKGYDFVAMNYTIGWTMMGQVPNYEINLDKALLVQTLFVREADVSDLWRLDLIGIEDAAETRKKEKCLEMANEHFKKTLKIDEEGRYEIALPFIDGCPVLKSNRAIAEQRLISMTRKLSSESKSIYQQIFDDWEASGIIEEVPTDQLDKFGHYLPHKAVINPKSLTTPVRPVFDASAKEKKSLSLNESLEKGPNLLEVITSVILRFRMRRYGLIADVKKAFLQISIRPEDRDYLRFLWWERDNDRKMKVYRHRRVVFGLTCSSFLLAATINEILDQAPQQYETTTKQLKNSNYVDNCVTSLDTEEAVVKFQNESVALFAAGKFELRGWEYNSPSYKNGLTKKVLVLGLEWDLADDYLLCDIDKGGDLEDGQVISKRKILAVAHKIFDPVGFTVPLVILPKLLLQDCWELKIGWNDEVPLDIAKKFRKWCMDLAKIKEVTIPRWIGLSTVNINSITLHIFTDASKSAYATGAFIRIEQEDRVIVNLLQAKARIAPIKRLSINRLELLGCLIGARLSNKLKFDMELSDVRTVYWTDSSNALHWITNEDQWGIYVWNRVEEIKKLTDVCSWRYVPGAMNPADLPSRGCTASQLVESSWWEGPEWLKLPEAEWPTVTMPPDEDVLNKERKKLVICNWEMSRIKTDTSWLLKFNMNFGEMVRFVAIMKPLVKNRNEGRRNRIYGHLSAKELDEAELHILKMIQNEAFVVNDPMLNKMELIQDEHQVLRVKTKILLLDDKESFKTPAVLPSKHPLVTAIIEYYHRENCHAGTQTLMGILREKYWIIKTRMTVKKIVKDCFICKWLTAKPFNTEPAQLPIDRIREAAIFEVSGVDLTGHLFLSDGSKAWIVLYTCAVYRAVRLDIVTSLTTKSFIQSLRRFIAKTGRPKIIYSDNGTNLRGTDNCLKDVDWKEIHQAATARRIDWRFIPSKAPWWGGWWERLIGVVKDLLKRVLGKANLDYEELRTILDECESIVNARPLTYLAEDPTELEALTPSMFLREIQECGVPDLDAVNSEKLNNRHRYRLQLKEHLQKRFRSEYISQLTHRKAAAATRPIEIGELVLISDASKKRVFWPLAKVIDIFPGKDGVKRVARVKTVKGELIRPVKLLIPLEIRPNENVLPLGIPERHKEEILALETSKKKKERKTATRKPLVTKPEEVVRTTRTRSGREVKQVQRLGT